MIINKKVGIAAYGAALPYKAVDLAVIESSQNRVIGSVAKALKVKQKTVPDLDEDAATLAAQAALQALKRLQKLDSKAKNKINALFVGSESHPYAVKPTGTIVARALGLSENLSLADLQFACKAGTQAMQIVLNYILAGAGELGLAIGTDTAQAKPGDALEFTASAGAMAVILGKKNLVAKILAATSIATDTPDFWRRPKQDYPQHAGRFTGEPAYFYHIVAATKKLLAEVDLDPQNIDFCIFHTPNGKFPRQAAQKLGFNEDQLQYSLVVEQIGNTYAAASPLALVNVLDHAKPKQKILLTSYGSGAGADSFLLETTSLLSTQKRRWQNFLVDQIQQLNLVSAQKYQQLIKRNH